jgi:hypothetical protein
MPVEESKMCDEAALLQSKSKTRPKKGRKANEKREF